MISAHLARAADTAARAAMLRALVGATRQRSLALEILLRSRTRLYLSFDTAASGVLVEAIGNPTTADTVFISIPTTPTTLDDMATSPHEADVPRLMVARARHLAIPIAGNRCSIIRWLGDPSLGTRPIGQNARHVLAARLADWVDLLAPPSESIILVGEADLAAAMTESVARSHHPKARVLPEPATDLLRRATDGPTAKRSGDRWIL